MALYLVQFWTGSSLVPLGRFGSKSKALGQARVTAKKPPARPSQVVNEMTGEILKQFDATRADGSTWFFPV